MSTITTDVNRHPTSTLEERLRKAGMFLVHCDDAGSVDASVHDSGWYQKLLVHCPMMRKLFADAASQWSNHDDPQTIEPICGLWMAPIPRLCRRKRSGYAVLVIPTDELLRSEQFAQLCQSAELDFELTKTMLSEAHPVPTGEVGRVVSLGRYLYEDAMRITEVEETMEGTGQQLAESYEEISLLYTIIQSMSDVQQPDRFVTITCEELLATLPYAWICAQLAHDPERLKKLSGRLVVTGNACVRESELRRFTEEMLATAQPNMPRVLEPGRNAAHWHYRDFGETIIVHPVTSDNRVIGLLVAGDKQGADKIASSVDMKLLGASASNMAIFLENAALYDDLNTMFLGTVEALTSSIDAKDRYTCGHSLRVAHLTQQIARASGMDETVVERMHIAGLVHDVGKIGVPEAVLLKPGKLTNEEFEWIRRHPEMGFRILKDIPQLKDVLPGVLYHHERWDGSGYPEGLVGEEIPVIARLIGLADAFDAMSSSRTYRSARERHEVLKEIVRCAGTQFDPELAPIFVKLDFSEYDRLVNEHRAGHRVDPILRHVRRWEAA